MSRKRRRNKHDKYGIYEIPNYTASTKKKKKKKKATVGGVIKLLFLILSLMVLAYIVAYCVKYSMKDEAMTLYLSGDYQGAVELFDEALKPQLPLLNDFDNDVRFYMADCYVSLKEYGQACHQYNMIGLWSDGTNEKAKYYRNIAYGLLLYSWKDYKQALPLLQSAYEDGYADLVLYVGSCYGQVGDLDNMQLYYNVFLQKHEMNSFMYAQYAAIALDEGDLDKAIEYIEAGKKLEDQSGIKELLFDEVVYYEKMKDYNTAFEKVDEFMKQYPNDIDGKNEYDLLYTRQTINSK